jgi:hypothetical protein
VEQIPKWAVTGLVTLVQLTGTSSVHVPGSPDTGRRPPAAVVAGATARRRSTPASTHSSTRALRRGLLLLRCLCPGILRNVNNVPHFRPSPGCECSICPSTTPPSSRHNSSTFLQQMRMISSWRGADEDDAVRSSDRDNKLIRWSTLMIQGFGEQLP